LGAGLGYRAMFHLGSDKLPVDVYRDRGHLPPPARAVPFCFPYPPQNEYKQAFLDRLADLVPFP
jgi:hypothetical protein